MRRIPSTSLPLHSLCNYASERKHRCMSSRSSDSVGLLGNLGKMSLNTQASALYMLSLALAGFTVAASSNTTTSIHFYNDKTGCVNHYFGCSDLPVGYCCASLSPYCSWVQCANCHAQTITDYWLLAHANGNCSDNPSFSCTATTVDNCCKTSHPDGQEPDICSALVVAESSEDVERGAECLGTREPNVFGIAYENGTVREFKLPHAMYESALVLATKQDLDGLVAHFSVHQ